MKISASVVSGVDPSRVMRLKQLYESVSRVIGLFLTDWIQENAMNGQRIVCPN